MRSIFIQPVDFSTLCSTPILPIPPIPILSPVEMTVEKNG